MNPSAPPSVATTPANAVLAAESDGPSRAEEWRRLPEIKPAARRYALRELARRAGVSKTFFDAWKVDVSPIETLVSFAQDSKARVRFCHGPEAGLVQNFASEIPVARARWPSAAAAGNQAHDLILPFCSSHQSSAPLYEIASDGSFHCRLDLLASIVLTLSRAEESLRPAADEHGRFPACDSLAFREHFLERPILDEHGLAFQQVLVSLLAGWRPRESCFRMKLTHDIDDVGIPFQLRTAIAHTIKRHRPADSVRDVFAALSPEFPAELSLVRTLAKISKSRGLHSAFFWKASRRTPHDSGYVPGHPKIQRVIDELRKSNFELGVHPGYDTFLNRENLAREVESLKSALRTDSFGGRQHYLRWNPQTWLDWESSGLRYDSSLGFADQFGFRAGTAFPYRPWCWAENRELNLIELPLLLMDCTPVKYMRLDLDLGIERIHAMVKRVRETGGVFTLLWHNTPLMDPDYNGWYEAVLDLLDGAKACDLPRVAADLW
jgi:hypothetical protein